MSFLWLPMISYDFPIIFPFKDMTFVIWEAGGRAHDMTESPPNEQVRLSMVSKEDPRISMDKIHGLSMDDPERGIGGSTYFQKMQNAGMPPINRKCNYLVAG